jgi:hypothetical protein
MVLSKQIYANHYFDASLSLTAAIGDYTHTNSNLLYVIHSRSAALAGSLSKIQTPSRRAQGHRGSEKFARADKAEP